MTALLDAAKPAALALHWLAVAYAAAREATPDERAAFDAGRARETR